MEFQLDLVRMLVLNLRSVDLLLLMVTGSPSLLQLRYVALHFQPLSDGDYMELVEMCIRDRPVRNSLTSELYGSFLRIFRGL